MKKTYLTALALVIAVNASVAQDRQDFDIVKSEVNNLSKEQRSILNELERLRKGHKTQASQISDLATQSKDVQAELNELEKEKAELNSKIDSLSMQLDVVATAQAKDRIRFNEELGATNTTVASNYNAMDTRTLWGGGLLAFCVLGFGGFLFVKRRKDATSMDKVRKAQEALQTAQAKMQEDSVKLDNQMLALAEKQMNASSAVASQGETDHSLALKVADEIVRIELNLSRMDSTVKGYKQLSKAVERIKNNFQANGYEIVDMLGKPYNEGMRVIANFVPDDTLAEGEQKITGITKPQINYKGKMIQAAQITVSQNI